MTKFDKANDPVEAVSLEMVDATSPMISTQFDKKVFVLSLTFWVEPSVDMVDIYIETEKAASASLPMLLSTRRSVDIRPLLTAG